MDNKQAAGLLKHHIKAWEGKFPSAHFGACKVAIEALTADKDEQAGRIMRMENVLIQARAAIAWGKNASCKCPDGTPYCILAEAIVEIDALLGGGEE